MKRSILISLAGLTLVAACTDSLTRPADVADAPNGRLAPRGPLLDDVANGLDASVDAIAEVMPLNVGGANGTTTLFVHATGSGQNPADGKSGCNFQGNTTSLVVSVSSSNTAVATVSPTSLTFDSCPDAQTISIKPEGPGSATISVTLGANTTTYSFTSDAAAFTVNVTGATNQAPQVSITGVALNGSYNKGSVPTATCNVIDVEDGNSQFAATLSDITGPYASDGIGSQTATCSYTDAGGLTASSSVPYTIIDPSAPTIGYTLNPATPDGNNGWYTGTVALTWSVSEPQSPNSLQKTGCVDRTITNDLAETTYSCSATSAGGSATQVGVTIKRDGTAPTVAYTSASTTTDNGPNAAGWYKDDVTATFTATDQFSGFGNPTSPTIIGTASTSGEGTNVLASSPAFTDNAGNIAAAGAATQGFKVDKTAPTNVEFVGGPAAGSNHYFGSVPAAPTCTADQGISGLASCAVTGYSNLVGTHTLTATAIDNAGNQSTATRTFTVDPWRLSGFYQPVDMNDVVNTVKAGSTVPLKFEMFVGPTELTIIGHVKSFTANQIVCNATAGTDDIEITTTGGTTLRYDETGGQFIQNWQTPKAVGTCYRATMTAQDGSKLTAYFKLK